VFQGNLPCLNASLFSFDSTLLAATLPIATCGISFSKTKAWRKVSGATPDVTEEAYGGYEL